MGKIGIFSGASGFVVIQMGVAGRPQVAEVINRAEQ
jgi:hypothetical protein